MQVDPVEDWFLGIDLGTGSCKTVVVDQAGRPLGSGTGAYRSQGGLGKFLEQDPEALLDGMVASVRLALADCGELPGDCAGMSIGGALHSFLALDGRDKPLTGVITWADNRAAELAASLRGDSQVKDLYKRTGCPVHGMYPLYKSLWMKVDMPDAFSRIAHVVSAKEYITWRLSGEFIVDYSLASGSGLLDTHELNWNMTALDLAELRPAQLSTPASPLTVLPGIDPHLAERMGIAAGTPLVLGSSDAVNSNLGTGSVYPWQATCNIGTSGALRIISTRPILDDRNRTWCYALDEAHWLVGGAINNAGLALDWLVQMFNSLPGMRLESPPLGFEDVIALAEQAPAGAGGLVCLPFLAGERSPGWNQEARALIFGLNLSHSSSHIARALLEGIGFRLRSIQDALENAAGEVCQVRASGGFTRSPLWLRIVASALNRQICVPRVESASALGSAFWPMMAAGLISELGQVRDMVKIDRIYLPDGEDAALYEQMLSIYNDLYRAVRAQFPRIAYLQESLDQTSPQAGL